jgi:hypothetical protein
MLLMKLMQSQGMGGQQQMQPPEPSEYEKWAAPGSIGNVPPGSTPLNRINRVPPGMPPNATTGFRG